MRPPGLLVIAYGGGVDSVAELILLRRAGEPPPTAIVMADPGDEKNGTLAYTRDWTNPRLRRWGWPEVTIISRMSEGQLRPVQAGRTRRIETLREECLRTNSLPSIAFGPKKCSQKFKGEPQRWWLDRMPWARAEWKAGRKLVRAIGYNFDEPSRVQRSNAVLTAPPPRPPEHRATKCTVCGTVEQPSPRCKWPRDYGKWERERFNFWYPCFEAKLTRDAELALIQSEGMPAPPKSSCKFCPNNQIEEWLELRDTDPTGFAEAVEMSRNAHDHIDSPDVVGLMRCNREGSRQLHEWADLGFPLGRSFPTTPTCECST